MKSLSHGWFQFCWLDALFSGVHEPSQTRLLCFDPIIKVVGSAIDASPVARIHQDCDCNLIDCQYGRHFLQHTITCSSPRKKEKLKGLEDFGVGSRAQTAVSGSHLAQPHPPCQLISSTFFEPGIATNPLLGNALQTSPVVRRQQHHRSGEIAAGFSSFLSYTVVWSLHMVAWRPRNLAVVQCWQSENAKSAKYWNMSCFFPPFAKAGICWHQVFDFLGISELPESTVPNLGCPRIQIILKPLSVESPPRTWDHSRCIYQTSTI